MILQCNPWFHFLLFLEQSFIRIVQLFLIIENYLYWILLCNLDLRSILICFYIFFFRISVAVKALTDSRTKIQEASLILKGIIDLICLENPMMIWESEFFILWIFNALIHMKFSELLYEKRNKVTSMKLRRGFFLSIWIFGIACNGESIYELRRIEIDLMHVHIYMYTILIGLRNIQHV